MAVGVGVHQLVRAALARKVWLASELKASSIKLALKGCSAVRAARLKRLNHAVNVAKLGCTWGKSCWLKNRVATPLSRIKTS